MLFDYRKETLSFKFIKKVDQKRERRKRKVDSEVNLYAIRKSKTGGTENGRKDIKGRKKESRCDLSK